MVVLGIDTATWTAAVGVVRDDAVLAEIAVATTQSHVRALPGLVAATLDRAGVRWDQVDGLAVSIGPGSFTGLRIGLAFAKGVAYAGGLPIAAVPTLEALAAVAEPAAGELVWAALDARMREVYAASFVRGASGGIERRSADEALAPDLLAGRLAPGCVLIGDAPVAYPTLGACGARVLPFASHHPRGGVVARLGAQRLRCGDAADVGSLEPRYVRPSQAESAARPSR